MSNKELKTILLIEDDMVLRENIEELLTLYGYNMITAANGRDGLEKAHKVLPDLILCDVLMPGMDGYLVLQELLCHEATQNIPFVFLSAKTEPKDILQGMDMGAYAYVKKPFEEDELIHAIKDAISKYKEA